MSAIAGILYFDKVPVVPGLIERLTTAMKSRGPDEQTHWVQGSIALGHCMLRTTPESLEEHQPLLSRDKKLAMVWDGRLDNREVLQREFKQRGIIPRDISDAELALQSYMVWGEDCPKKLLGDFAFAVWDRENQHLFCVRDPMGAKPFAYVRNSRYFAFASSEEALLNLPDVSHEPSEEFLASILVPDSTDMESWQGSMRDVWGFPNGQCMTIAVDGRASMETYWSPASDGENTYASDHEFIEDFLDVFGKAVDCRLRISGEPAVMMSGGLDSASIVAMMRRLLPDSGANRINSYSVIAEDPKDCIESTCIHSLARKSDVCANYLSIPAFDGSVGMEDLKELAWRRAHPVGNSILIPGMMYLAAGRHGRRVMLHGACGDLTARIPDRYVAHFLRHRQWGQAWLECTGAFPNMAYWGRYGPPAILLLNAWSAFVPERFKRTVRKLRRKAQASPLAGSLIKPEFASKLQLQDRIKELHSRNAGKSRAEQKHAEMVNQISYMVSAQSASESVAQRCGVESRDPWADRRVVEFFMRTPLQFKVRNGWTKYPMRAAFATDLETVVSQRRSKEHLGWNVKQALMSASTCMIEENFETYLAALAEYVDADAARARFRDYQLRHDSSALDDIFEIITLAFWLDRVSV